MSNLLPIMKAVLIATVWLVMGDCLHADSSVASFPVENAPVAVSATTEKLAADAVKSDGHDKLGELEVGSDPAGGHHSGDAVHGHDSHIGEKGVSDSVIPAKPRLDMVIYSMAVFLVLLAILTNYAWGPIVKALDEREAQITNNIESAQQKLASAEALLAEHRKKLDAVHDEVRAILAEARRDAEHTKNEIVATANKEAKLMQDRAVEEISRAKDQALNELFGNVSSQVAKATEQVIRRSLTNEDRERFVSEAVSQFVSRN